MENQAPMGHPNKQIQEILGDKLSSLIHSRMERIVELIEGLEESMPPSVYRRSISWLLSWAKPFLRASGFRIRLVSESSIEAILPFRPHSSADVDRQTEEIDEGLLLSGAVFCFHSLIKRNFSSSNVKVVVKRIEIDCHRPLVCDLYFVCEFPALKREVLFAQLSKDVPVDLQVAVAVKDRFGVLLSEVQLNAQVLVNPSLEWKKT